MPLNEKETKCKKKKKRVTLVPTAASVCLASFALRTSSPPGCCPSKPRCLYNGMLIMLGRLQNAPQPLQFNDCKLLTRLSVHANGDRFLGGTGVLAASLSLSGWGTYVKKELVSSVTVQNKSVARQASLFCAPPPFVHWGVGGRWVMRGSLTHIIQTCLSTWQSKEARKRWAPAEGRQTKESRAAAETKRSGWDLSLPLA